jgi:formylglycine-generating enzyme required for sulfatase activity
MAPTQTHEPKVNINRSAGQNPCFDELLGEGLRLRMMQISGGTFEMGSPKDELDNYEDESPQHEVSVETFFMGKHPVTQSQWRFVAGLEQVSRALEPDPSHFKGDDRPVEKVSWEEAVEFCDRLSRHTNKQYHLPSEAQWEYACRAGTTTPFHFGNTITTDLANYRGTDKRELNWSGFYGDSPKGEYRETTTPVDYFDLANAFGLCDMHGNVWEWCSDHWHDNYESAPTDGGAWLTDNETANRVLRGGSWLINPRYCRSASRDDYLPGDRSSSFGFRVSCHAPRTLQPPTD